MTSPQVGQPPKAKKQKREKPVLEPLLDDGHPGHSQFARALASTDYQTREKGLHALKSWLLRRTDLQEPDMMKIWKGLFYCFWHSDKTPVQAELAERLAAILSQLPPQSAYLYFTAFMTTMRREWFGIDRLRMDKFLLLIRKFIHHMLACLKASKWHADLVQRYGDYLHHHVMLPGDTLPAAGVAYHCSDVMLQELRTVADGKAIPASAMSSLLEPFVAALQNGEQTALQRIGEGLFDTLLSELVNPADNSHYLQKLDVTGLAAQLFERAAAAGVRVRNRQVLHDLSRTLEKLQRKRQRMDEAAQASPSAHGETVKKPTKKHLRGKRKADLPASEAAASTVEPSAANGVMDHRQDDMQDAHAAGPKRKAKDHDSEVADLQQQDSAVAGSGDKGTKPKLVKKKQRKQELLHGNGTMIKAVIEGNPGSETASPKATANGRDAGNSHREPTLGQKAALRAAVAKLSAAPNMESSAAQPKKLISTVQQHEPGVIAAAAQKASSPARAADSKVSVLGKRIAPSSVEVIPTAVQELQHQGNGAEASAKTPSQPKRCVKEGGRSRAATTAKKARVVINLKKNLYFEHGGPVPDLDVRTPPPARAKGGILKKAAQSCPPKVASASVLTSAGKQRRQETSGKPMIRVVPKQARRASAALFF